MPVKGFKAQQIIKRAQRELTNERIRQHNFTLQVLTEKKLEIENELFKDLPVEAVDRIRSFTLQAQLNQHNQTKERQKSKYQRLIVTRKSDNNEVTQIQDKWVKNLSDRQLTSSETRVLARGLNYAITPQRIPIVDYITGIESAIHYGKLPSVEAEQLRRSISTTINNTKLQKSNISREERKALESIKGDKSIIVLPADKGRCTVLLNKQDYDTKIQDLLNDTTTYEKLSRNPTSKFKERIIGTLKELERSGAIDRRLYLKLYPTSENPPTFYGLPKIHKATIPLQPIVSSIGSITYEIAKHLAGIIGPLTGRSSHHIKNSGDFVEKIREIKLNPDQTIVSYDVTALFTCIPPDDALVVVKECLERDVTLQHRTPLSPTQLTTLLDLCLKTTYFLCNSLYYKQNHGCAMGSPVSPIVVNLYMENFEKKALASYEGTPPSHWYRYVDDTWVLIKKSELDSFSQHINNIDQNIKFTQETLINNQLAFLDCLVHVQSDGSLKTSVYRKTTHTDQYLLFDSHHPLNQKLGVIRTLFHRAKTLASSNEERTAEEQHLRKALKQCGYRKWTFHTALKKTSRQSEDREIQRNIRPTKIVLPYIANLSESVQRICRSFNITTSFKPAETLRRRLVHP